MLATSRSWLAVQGLSPVRRRLNASKWRGEGGGNASDLQRRPQDASSNTAPLSMNGTIIHPKRYQSQLCDRSGSAFAYPWRNASNPRLGSSWVTCAVPENFSV